MIKKILLTFIILLSISLQAQTQEEKLLETIKSNPALLDTPQAKLKMAQMGVSKEEILTKLSPKKEEIDKKESLNEKLNDIEIEENDSLNKDLNITKETNSTGVVSKTTYINPLEYKTNEVLLEELTSLQTQKEDKELNRFGLDFFKNKNNINPTTLPVPSYYLLNNSDVLTVWLYGTTNDNLNLEVDNNGNINIPKIGPLKVLGKTFKEVSSLLKAKLKKTYPNTNISINITQYSTIQVSLVGNVNAPGVYNINALSTVKNLLIEANGIKDNGSLRNVVIKRDGKVLAIIDFYNLLKNGDQNLDILLKSGDTIFVPKAENIVSINGAISTPAKFEIKENETLKTLLNYAGGLSYNGSKFGFMIKRYESNKEIKTFKVDLNEAKLFKLLNGDNIYIYNVDKVHDKSIYIYGNVIRPGERALNVNFSLYELLNKEIKTLSIKGVFLDKTLFNYALIKRKMDSLETKLINFNLEDLLSQKIDIKLKNNDELYIFNKYNSNLTPFVSIIGEPVLKPGKYDFAENMRVKDLINISGFEPYTKIKLTTYNTEDMMPEVKFVDENYKLSKFDEIELFDYYMTNKIKTISISGEVFKPNNYILNKNMFLNNAIEIAGGFTQKAFKKHFEVLRYYVENDERKRKIFKVSYKEINSFKLEEDDEIKIFTIPNWYEKRTVVLKGEVKFPGVYTIESGEKLSSIIRRAGGFTKEAFIEGSVFTRESIKKNEEKRVKESMAKLKQQMTYISTNGREAGTKDTSSAELLSTIKMLEEQTSDYVALGRLVIYLDKDLDSFERSQFNIRLEDKDTLIIPSLNDTISIYGEVLNPNTFVFNKNLTSDDYIKKAGGLTQRADTEFLYLVLPNGEAKPIKYDTWFEETQTVSKGSTIVVPMKINTVSNLLLWKDISQIVYQLAITSASLNTVGAI